MPTADPGTVTRKWTSRVGPSVAIYGEEIVRPAFGARFEHPRTESFSFNSCGACPSGLPPLAAAFETVACSPSAVQIRGGSAIFDLPGSDRSGDLHEVRDYDPAWQQRFACRDLDADVL